MFSVRQASPATTVKAKITLLEKQDAIYDLLNLGGRLRKENFPRYQEHIFKAIFEDPILSARRGISFFSPAYTRGQIFALMAVCTCICGQPPKSLAALEAWVNDCLVPDSKGEYRYCCLTFTGSFVSNSEPHFVRLTIRFEEDSYAKGYFKEYMEGSDRSPSDKLAQYDIFKIRTRSAEGYPLFSGTDAVGDASL